jgi:hypothetical protein
MPPFLDAGPAVGIGVFTREALVSLTVLAGWPTGRGAAVLRRVELQVHVSKTPAGG